jgi:bifunctional DNA primase/polymerase-like protein
VNALRLTTSTWTTNAEGAKRPATAQYGWEYNAAWFPPMQHRPWELPGQPCLIHHRATGTLVLDVDNLVAWPGTHTGRELARRGGMPWVTRGRKGGHYLVATGGIDLVGTCGLGGAYDIRSKNLTPVAGTVHPAGEPYALVPGPDAVMYPGGEMAWTHVVRLDEILVAAILADGGKLRTAGQADPDDRDLAKVMKDEDYPDDIADEDYPPWAENLVLGNWLRGKRHESLVGRCGVIKAMVIRGVPGVRKLYDALDSEYQDGTGRTGEVKTAFRNCYPRLDAVDSAVDTANFGWMREMHASPEAAADRQRQGTRRALKRMRKYGVRL